MRQDSWTTRISQEESSRCCSRDSSNVSAQDTSRCLLPGFSTKAPTKARPHSEGNSHELKIIRPYQTIFYDFINFPGHHIGNSLNGTPAPPGMASMQCTCKPSCASSRPCLGTAFLLVDNVGCCLLLRKTPKSQKKNKTTRNKSSCKPLPAIGSMIISMCSLLSCRCTIFASAQLNSAKA